MIYTLTTNPAVDVTMTMDSFKSHTVNRPKSEEYSANGKGINVAYVLQKLGVPVATLGFFGGFSGKYIAGEVQNKGIACYPVFVDGITRINFSVTTADGEEYKVSGNGCAVSPEKQRELLTLIDGLQDMDMLVVSGSLSPGMEPCFYDELAVLLEKKNVPLVLDISSPYLKDLLKYRPLLIKPNEHELAEVFGLSCATQDEVKASMQQLHAWGVENVLLTMGEKGMYFSNGSELYFTDTYPIEFVSSVCAGDGTLGAFLSVWRKTDVTEALKLAAAVGADIVGSLGRGELERYPYFKEKIIVRKCCQ
jgi:1-phosphofructokinase/6-phosphofructokinase 2